MKHPVSATAAFLCLCLSLPAFDQAAPSSDTTNTKKHPVAPPGVKIEWDLSYLDGKREEKLDLYLPANRAGKVLSPAVVIIHGGGWTKNDKADHREFIAATTLAKNGYVCVSINYWMEKEEAPFWPRNLQDCKNAVRWLRKQAKKYRVDPDRIGVLGASAGGHLALLVAYTPGVKGLEPRTPYPGVSDSVRAVVDMYGPTDLLTRHHHEKVNGKWAWEPSKLFPKKELNDISGKDLSVREQAEKSIGKANLPKWKLASPINHVSKHSPPTLILHGTKDNFVNIGQSAELVKNLHAHKVEHTFIKVPGAHHLFAIDGSYPDGKTKSKPKTKDVSADVVAFFDKHLKHSR